MDQDNLDVVDKIDNSQDEKQDKQLVDDDLIVVRNVHKTYLLGVEGVTALRGMYFSTIWAFLRCYFYCEARGVHSDTGYFGMREDDVAKPAWKHRPADEGMRWNDGDEWLGRCDDLRVEGEAINGGQVPGWSAAVVLGVRVPDVQLDPIFDGLGERGVADDAEGGAVERADKGAGERAVEEGGSGGAGEPLPEPAVGRGAAESDHREGAVEQPEDPAAGRAHWRPGHEELGPDHEDHRGPQPQRPHHHHHGHPRHRTQELQHAHHQDARRQNRPDRGQPFPILSPPRSTPKTTARTTSTHSTN